MFTVHDRCRKKCVRVWTSNRIIDYRDEGKSAWREGAGLSNLDKVYELTIVVLGVLLYSEYEVVQSRNRQRSERILCKPQILSVNPVKDVQTTFGRLVTSQCALQNHPSSRLLKPGTVLNDTSWWSKSNTQWCSCKTDEVILVSHSPIATKAGELLLRTLSELVNVDHSFHLSCLTRAFPQTTNEGVKAVSFGFLCVELTYIDTDTIEWQKGLEILFTVVARSRFGENFT